MPLLMKTFGGNCQEIPKCTQKNYSKHLRYTKKGRIVGLEAFNTRQTQGQGEVKCRRHSFKKDFCLWQDVKRLTTNNQQNLNNLTTKWPKICLWHQFVSSSSFVLCSDVVLWTWKTIRIQPWVITWIETDTLPRHVFPPAVLFFWCVIWCVCDVLFDAHQMFIFPSPDGGTCLFLRELLGDRREGRGLTVSQSQKILK